MCEDYGYHTEINEMLNGMEQLFAWEGSSESFSYRILPATANVIIPSEHVFFFIEKVPGTPNLEGAVEPGTAISAEWADNILPGLPTINSYRGKNRFVEMSRMYFWAQEFQRRFPHEMRVFYEDDEMVCWYFHQPDADWTDLSIDYGYNDRTPRLMLKELTGQDPGELEYGDDGEYHTRAFRNATWAGLAARDGATPTGAEGAEALEQGTLEAVPGAQDGENAPEGGEAP